MSSSQIREVNVQIHGNNIVLRGDSLRRDAAQFRGSRLSAASVISDTRPAAEAGKAEGAADESQFLLLTLSNSSQETHEAIQTAGAAVLNYVTDGVYLYKRDHAVDVAEFQNIPGVLFVDVYPSSVKVHVDLHSKISTMMQPEAARLGTTDTPDLDVGSSGTAASAGPPPIQTSKDATVSMEIHFHKGTSKEVQGAILDHFSSIGCLLANSVQVFDTMAVATARADRVYELTTAPEIYVIQRKVSYSEDDVFATDVLGVAGPILLDAGYVVPPDPSALPGDPILPYDGSGETISVGDSGFDRGHEVDMADLTNVHPAFSAHSEITFHCIDTSHRNIPAVAITPSCLIDTRGHGTHVCGCAVGYSRQPSSSGAGSVGYIKGSAPGARLVFTQLLTHNPDPANKTFFDGPMLDIYRETVKEVAAGSPAPIFSQSWGVNWAGETTPKPGYDVNVEAFDTVLRDEDVLVCRSAGNDGNSTVYKGICGRYAAGKNVLTVGACQSSSNQWVQPFPDVTSNAAKDPQPRAIPNNPRIVAPFSCSGTQEGRQKPDVVAPGYVVLSARSRDAAPPLPEFTALDGNYCFKSGTSMATPLTAGCAAVLNQALRVTDSSYTGHSGTLLKALIVNGAVTIPDPKMKDLDPQIETSNIRPWGFGRVNVLSSLSHLALPSGAPGDVLIGDYRRGTLSLGGRESWNLRVPEAERTPGCVVDDSTLPSVKVTMCFADTGNSALQALFYFTLTHTATGKVRFGNRRGWVDKDEAKDPVKRPNLADSFNNVQQIFCTDVDAGNYSIAIHYFQNNTGLVPSPQIPYAVAWLVF